MSLQEHTHNEKVFSDDHIINEGKSLWSSIKRGIGVSIVGECKHQNLVFIIGSKNKRRAFHIIFLFCLVFIAK